MFVQETDNPAIIRAGQTVTVNPRRGSWDKEPWRSLDLNKITDNTIESVHVHAVHLGETIVPYTTLEPLRAALPIRYSDMEIPTDPNGVGGIRLGGLEQRMRERWRIISRFWEENKQRHNKLDLLANLDHYGKLSSQLEWRKCRAGRPLRLVYTRSGIPTAALLLEDRTLLDTTTYWVTCKDIQEAHYLLAIINSDALFEKVAPLMPKGQFGARDLHKHLWKLPIPEFNPDEPKHAAVSEAGRVAAEGASKRLAQLRRERDSVTVTIARREIRKWLRESKDGKTVEEMVRNLLDGC